MKIICSAFKIHDFEDGEMCLLKNSAGVGKIILSLSLSLPSPIPKKCILVGRSYIVAVNGVPYLRRYKTTVTIMT